MNTFYPWHTLTIALLSLFFVLTAQTKVYVYILYKEPLRFSNLVVLHCSCLLNSNKISQREVKVTLVTVSEQSGCCAVHFLLRLRVLFPLAITLCTVTPKTVCYFFFTHAYAGAWIL